MLNHKTYNANWAFDSEVFFSFSHRFPVVVLDDYSCAYAVNRKTLIFLRANKFVVSKKKVINRINTKCAINNEYTKMVAKEFYRSSISIQSSANNRAAFPVVGPTIFNRNQFKCSGFLCNFLIYLINERFHPSLL